MADMNDYIKIMVMMQLAQQVPAFLREKLLHRILNSLDFKLTNDELEQLHNFLNPPQFLVGPPVSFGHNVRSVEDQAKDIQETIKRFNKKVGPDQDKKENEHDLT